MDWIDLIQDEVLSGLVCTL